MTSDNILIIFDIEKKCFDLPLFIPTLKSLLGGDALVADLTKCNVKLQRKEILTHPISILQFPVDTNVLEHIQKCLTIQIYSKQEYFDDSFDLCYHSSFSTPMLLLNIEIEILKLLNKKATIEVNVPYVPLRRDIEGLICELTTARSAPNLFNFIEVESSELYRKHDDEDTLSEGHSLYVAMVSKEIRNDRLINIIYSTSDYNVPFVTHRILLHGYDDGVLNGTYKMLGIIISKLLNESRKV